ncbi:MAG: hypothetical protein JWP10_258, partial [Nocardioidaceae bacterium]|nr:hypothetical protein [Nocardioidaceae bacterium]
RIGFTHAIVPAGSEITTADRASLVIIEAHDVLNAWISVKAHARRPAPLH